MADHLSNLRFPNTFIIGAPKCGTTSLAHYLREHPRVFMTRLKEPNWFCEDIPELRDVPTESAYFALYAERTADHLAVGEASTWYLFSTLALRRIREFNPQAKVIAMVRNPVDLVHSLWGQYMFNFGLVDGDFESAWRTPMRPSPQYHLPKVGRIGEQIERAFRAFPRGQIKVIVYDDFTRDTGAVYRDVLRFIGVPDDGRTDFPAANRSKAVASPKLARFVRDTPAPFVHALRAFKRVTGLRRIGVLDRVEQLNVREFTRPPLSAEMRAEMLEEFRDDILLLQELLDRDLSAWLAGSGRVPNAAPAEQAG